MQFYSESLTLKDNTFALLRDLIHERIGLFFDETKKETFADKLTPLVMDRSFDSFLDYFYLLKYDATAKDEWLKVMDALSVQETFFWREMDQIRSLVNVMLPEYIRKNPFGPIRIWSAACATGEEPLTIAMTLEEAGILEGRAIEIMASDASPKAIQKAGQGIYRERSFRNLPTELRSKFFEDQGSTWKVTPLLHSRIQWRIANLMDEAQIAPMASAPFIFCRNVFIYFSEHTIRKTVERFYERMPRPGYLFVAAAESLLKITTRFELQEIGGAFVYVKG